MEPVAGIIAQCVLHSIVEVRQIRPELTRPEQPRPDQTTQNQTTQDKAGQNEHRLAQARPEQA
eukprot:2012902-Lingulodinium_polyedra.AAC.1